MGKLKVKFHPLFILYVFLCLYFGWFNNVFYYVVTIVIHEYAHYFMATKLGYPTNGMLFTIYGAGLNTSNIYKIKDDIKISLAGPIINFIIIILIICFWWLIPTTYLFTYDFFISNLVVMLFNLIPIYPLDGGRVIVALISSKIKRKKVIKINNFICFGLGLFFITLFIISMFFTHNLNLLFIGLFLSLNSVLSDKNDYFERIKAYNKNLDTPCEVKVFKINSLDKKEMLKCLSPNYYSIFITTKENNKIIREDDLLK